MPHKTVAEPLPPIGHSAGLAAIGLRPAAHEPPGSTLRFPDGGSWRVEIPSVEGVAALETVLDTARELDVAVHRVSQGSGVLMHTDDEIRAMVSLCTAASVELCLFVRPGANWDIGAARDSAAGSIGPRARGLSGLSAALREATRAVELGVRSLLIADDGVLWTLHRMRADGHLPAELQLKVSVLTGAANPAALAVQERLGADTVNVPSDLTIAQLAELREASAVGLDLYVESPDNIGGFVRHHEICELVRVAAPVYLKFGLRNAPDVYPAGGHLSGIVCASARERVRRAHLGLQTMKRLGGRDYATAMSPPGSREQARSTRFPGQA